MPRGVKKGLGGRGRRPLRFSDGLMRRRGRLKNTCPPVRTASTNSGERVRGCAAHPALPRALPCLHRQRNRPSENGFYGVAGRDTPFQTASTAENASRAAHCIRRRPNRVRGCATHPTSLRTELRPSENRFTRAAAAAAASRFRGRSRRRFCRVRRAAAGCRPLRG